MTFMMLCYESLNGVVALTVDGYSVFSLTWPASMQTYWNKRKGLHKRTGLGHKHGRRFIVLGHKYGRHDVMWKQTIFFPILMVDG